MFDPEDWPRLWWTEIIKPCAIILLIALLAALALAFYAGTQI